MASTVKVAYEMTTCTRCAGSGMFGPRSIDGGRCFACQGERKILTANGKRAKDRYTVLAAEMLTPLTGVKTGDVVQLSLMDKATGLRSWTVWTVARGVEIADRGVKLNDDPVRTGRVLIDTTGKLAAWSSPLITPADDAQVMVWSDEIHEQAARSVANLKGATVTGL